MFNLNSNIDNAKPVGFRLVTQAKKKNVFLYHTTARLPNKNLRVSTERTDTNSVKEFELNQAQADVYIHQMVAECLANHPDDVFIPYMSLLGLPSELRHIRERDILVRFRVPEVSMSWIDDKVDVVHSPVEITDEEEFYPTDGRSNFKLGVLTIYPNDSGLFATMKTEKGYEGLPMSHWMSLIPFWRETTVKTEIAVLIDSEAQALLGGIGENSNKRGYTPLGVISGFFNGNVEQYSQAITKARLLSAALFEDARAAAKPSDIDAYGIGFSMYHHSVKRLDCRRAVVMEILDFDSASESWRLGFSDEREPVTSIPYNYSDFLAKGYLVAVVALVNNGVFGKILSYEFHSSSFEEECSVTQLDG